MSKNVINRSYITQNETIIVGLSGGPDSVFLLYQLIELQKIIPFTIIAAHLNHEWRPTAQRDQDFCTNLCKSLSIECVTQKISQLEAPEYKNRSQEAQGRYYRKFFLESVQNRYKAHKIFLAHHQDDQIETFFIKLIRGTTVDGLGCLKTINKQYYRPLLNITKTTILEYLTINNIPYVHDESNDNMSYLRNKIRKQLIPVLSEIDHRASFNTLRAIESIQENNAFITHHVYLAYNAAIVNNTLNLLVFNTFEPFLQNKLLLQWLYTNKCPFTPSNAFVNEILRFFATQENGSHTIHEAWKITKKHPHVSITWRK